MTDQNSVSVPPFIKEYGRIGHGRRRRAEVAMAMITPGPDPARLGDYKRDIGVFS